MITVKTDAIKFRNSEGQMQSAGVLCNVGTFGIDLSKYLFDIEQGFRSVDFGDDFILTLQLDSLQHGVAINSLRYAFMGMNAKKLILKSVQKEMILPFIDTFANSKLREIDISDFDVYIADGAVFRNCQKLERINGIIKFYETPKNISNMFYGCYALIEVRFASETIPISISFANSPLLSATSRQSIIDGLVDLTGQTAQTITFHKDIEAKLSDEQKAQITSKNWTLAFSK